MLEYYRNAVFYSLMDGPVLNLFPGKADGATVGFMDAHQQAQ